MVRHGDRARAPAAAAASPNLGRRDGGLLRRLGSGGNDRGVPVPRHDGRPRAAPRAHRRRVVRTLASPAGEVAPLGAGPRRARPAHRLAWDALNESLLGGAGDGLRPLTTPLLRLLAAPFAEALTPSLPAPAHLAASFRSHARPLQCPLCGRQDVVDRRRGRLSGPQPGGLQGISGSWHPATPLRYS